MEQLLYIIPLAIVPALLYCLLLFINLPFKTVNLKVSLWHMLAGVMSVVLLFTFFKLFPSWNHMGNNLANPVLERVLNLHITYFVQVGFIEELSKLAAFLLFFNYRRNNKKHLNDKPIGTIVYIAMISLGFAVIENIMYAMHATSPLSSLIWRSFTAMLAHLLFGLYMGYFIVRGRLQNNAPRSYIAAMFWRFPKIKRVLYAGVGLFVASMIHGLYDLQLVLNSPNGLSGAYILFAALTVGIVLCFKDIIKKTQIN